MKNEHFGKRGKLKSSLKAKKKGSESPRARAMSRNRPTHQNPYGIDPFRQLPLFPIIS